MALSADSARLGATTNRILNKLAFALANEASDITTAATGDRIPMVDASADYELKYADGANVLEMIGTTASAAELDYLDITAAGTSQASKALVLDSSEFLDWAVTSASTDGGASVEPLNFDVTMTGAGGVGGRAKFTLTTNVALGGWSNALKAQVTYGAAGKTTGLGSAFVAEMTLSAGTAAGTYAPIEIELNMGAAGVTGTATSLIYASVNDAAATAFDTSGYILNIQGLTGAEDKAFDDAVEISNVNEITGGLRIKVGAADYYILLATAADAADA